MRLKTIIRNLLRSRFNSFVIIISLAIGMACINLISIFIIRENNVDVFQKNKKRIYALQADNSFRKGQKMYYIRYGAAEYMKNNFAEVDDFCRIKNSNPKKILVNHQDFYDAPKVISTSSNFFRFFSYPLIVGSPGQVLTTSHDIVISEKLACKYFGNSDPVGQNLTLVNRENQEKMVVSGIFKIPEESTQLNFNMVRLIGEEDSRCYLLLHENTDIAQLEEKFAENKNEIPIIHDGTPGTHYLKCMKATYFDTSRRQTIENSRDKNDLVIALIIALMILSVALFNYLGLINNLLMEKKREYAIRMVTGGRKKDMVVRFMSEIFMLVGGAWGVSLCLMLWVLPSFNELVLTKMTIAYIFKFENVLLLLGISFIILLITFLFIYLKIERKLNIEDLKTGNPKSDGKFQIPAFNVAQLAVSVALIVCSMVISKQISYITNKDIGIDKNILEVKIPKKYEKIAPVFKTELEKRSSVEMVSQANSSPVLEYFKLLMHYEENGEKKQYTPAVFVGDENYMKTLGIEIVSGNVFSENSLSNENKCIVNESLAALFPKQDLIGKNLPGSKDDIVIGICKDFHYGSLKDVIAPGYILCGKEGFYLMVKPVCNQMTQVRKSIAEIWEKLIPDFPVNMESIGDRYEWMHRENSNYAKLIGVCSILSVFLSMIGLFAVSFHTCRRRIKEIGIRKVNGAKTFEVMAMLNRDFVKWVACAFLISSPIAWYVMTKWLENFAYKTTLSWWIFVLAGVLALGIALLTVSWQSWKAATRNPVEALRYE